MIFKRIIILVLIIFIVIFTIQNAQTVSVSFLFYSVTLPLAFILLITVVAGVIIGMLFKFDQNKLSKGDKKESID